MFDALLEYQRKRRLCSFSLRFSLVDISQLDSGSRTMPHLLALTYMMSPSCIPPARTTRASPDRVGGRSYVAMQLVDIL